MLLALPLLLVASGFFSGSETALFSLSEHQRYQFKRSGTLAGSIIAQLVAEPRGLLITLMLGNMVVNVLYFVITTLLMIHLEASQGLGAVAMTLIGIGVLVGLILCGEVMPKLVAARIAETWAKVTAVPLFVCHRVIAPLRAVLNVLVITPLARLIAPKAKPPQLSPDELAALLELSQHRGVIDPDEEQILQQVLALGQLKVRNLMTPRVDLEAFDLGHPVAELIDLIRSSRRRHIPVYNSDMDHIEGVVFARRVVLARPQSIDELKQLIEPVHYVPETQRADRLLLDMRKLHSTFVVAVDEYGGTSGIVTMEDVVEQMIGEIPGPGADETKPAVQSLAPGRWRVGAHLQIHDWRQAFGDSGQAPMVSTVGGLVMATLGHLPHIGEQVRIGNLVIEVERMNERRIDTLLLRLAEGEGGTP